VEYKQITEPNVNGLCLDLNTEDGYIVVWEYDKEDEEIYIYAEWPAIEVYKQLKAYFEGPEDYQLPKVFDEYGSYGENNPPVAGMSNPGDKDYET